MVDNKALARRLISVLRERYPENTTAVHRTSNRDVFRTLVGCVLSQRTREENTERAASRLFAVAGTPEEIMRLPEKRLQALIKEAGFYRQKAKNIRLLSRKLVDEYGGEVPRKREELMALPGVGYKTADVVLCYGLGVPTIPVDVHVNVISKRLGLVPENASLEEVRETLERFVLEKDRGIVNRGLVMFGREICLTRKPRCSICPLSDGCCYYRTKVKEIN
jgi:endonuclease-3